jgi:site-specific recombinase XerD
MNEKIESYISTLARSENTRKTYRRALEKYFSVVSEVDNASYEMFLTKISKLPSPTKAVLQAAVMGLFDYMKVDGYDERRRLNRHYIGKNDKQPVKIEEDDIEKTVDYCEKLSGDLESLRDKTFVLMAVDSGFRISELCSLKRGDIDLRNEKAFVTGKGNKQAFVRLSARSIVALRTYLSTRQSMDGETGKPMNSLPLFHNDRSKKLKGMTADGMRKAIKQRMKDAGIDPHNVRIHDFRHYFVTTTLRASDMKTAKEFARHESVATTDRYAHLSEQELDEKYNRIFNK